MTTTISQCGGWSAQYGINMGHPGRLESQPGVEPIGQEREDGHERPLGFPVGGTVGGTGSVRCSRPGCSWVPLRTEKWRESPKFSSGPPPGEDREAQSRGQEGQLSSACSLLGLHSALPNSTSPGPQQGALTTCIQVPGQPGAWYPASLSLGPCIRAAHALGPDIRDGHGLETWCQM